MWDNYPVLEEGNAAVAAAVAAVVVVVAVGGCNPLVGPEGYVHHRGRRSKTLSEIDRFEERGWTVKSSCANGLRERCRRYRRMQHLAETQGLYGDYGRFDHDGPP